MAVGAQRDTKVSYAALPDDPLEKRKQAQKRKTKHIQKSVMLFAERHSDYASLFVNQMCILFTMKGYKLAVCAREDNPLELLLLLLLSNGE